MRSSLQASALVTLLLSSGASIAIAANHGRDCEKWPTQTRELQASLGRQVIAAANFASSQSEVAATKLDALVARDAVFEMGASDVGRPFGQGPAGLRRLMSKLQADRYRFDGWDAMSRTEQPCGVHEVTVEFSSIATPNDWLQVMPNACQMSLMGRSLPSRQVSVSPVAFEYVAACGTVAGRCAPGVPGGHGRCGRAGRGLFLRRAAI